MHLVLKNVGEYSHAVITSTLGTKRKVRKMVVASITRPQKRISLRTNLVPRAKVNTPRMSMIVVEL